MPDSVLVKVVAIALIIAGAASAQTSNRTMQVRYVPVERALEAAKAVRGVAATADRRTNRLVLSGPAADVGKASELAMRQDLPQRGQTIWVIIDDLGSMHTPVWAGIVSVQPGRATSFSVETPGGIQSRTGATAVKGRVWVEGGPAKLSVRAEVQVTLASGVEDLRGTVEIEPQKGARLAKGRAVALQVNLAGDHAEGKR